MEQYSGRAEMIPGALQERKFILPEDLEGEEIFPFMGDRTAAGRNLTHIGGRELSQPVHLEGGADYMRAQASQGPDASMWASGSGVVSNLDNRIRKARETGRDVNAIYMPMSGSSGDYATMTSDAIMGQIPDAKITAKAAKQFDTEMRSKVPDWPGIRSEGARDYLVGSGKARSFLPKIMGKADYQKQGFPDIGQTRWAISEPELIGRPPGEGGYAIGRPDNRVINNPAIPHKTYDTQMGGQYRGGFDVPIPRSILFRDWNASRRASGAPWADDEYTFSRQLPSQHVDPQLVETMMRYREQMLQRGGR